MDLELIWGRAARRLLSQLREAATPRERAERLDAFLLPRLSSDPTPTRCAWRWIQRTRGQTSIRELTRMLDISERRLERLSGELTAQGREPIALIRPIEREGFALAFPAAVLKSDRDLEHRSTKIRASQRSLPPVGWIRARRSR